MVEDKANTPAKDRVCVGAIAGAFGVKGEVRLKSFCADPQAIADYGPLETEDRSTRYSLRLTRAVKGGFAARIDGIRSKEAADDLRGTRLYVDRAALPDPDEDEFYYSDLIGMSVRDTGGAELGRVKAVLNHGASDLLEVAARSREPVLVPFTRDIVPTVDLGARIVVIDPPEGLFPEVKE